MLTDQDIRKIGEEMGKVSEDNIMPQFDAMHADIAGVKGEVGGLKTEIGSLKVEVQDLGRRVTRIDSSMVTKDYLDDKLADLRGGFALKQRD